MIISLVPHVPPQSNEVRARVKRAAAELLPRFCSRTSPDAAAVWELHTLLKESVFAVLSGGGRVAGYPVASSVRSTCGTKEMVNPCSDRPRCCLFRSGASR